MKTSTQLWRTAFIAGAAILILGAGTMNSSADPYAHKGGPKHHHQAWSHDNHGYWDNHYNYHSYSYTTYRGYHGYWQPQPSGVSIFIRL